jgi:hypothetical protein
MHIENFYETSDLLTRRRIRVQLDNVELRLAFFSFDVTICVLDTACRVDHIPARKKNKRIIFSKIIKII